MKNIRFNAQHSPVGAFASFTLGCPGKSGGLGLELGGPANENVFVGMESPSDERSFEALPFFEGAGDEARRYEVDSGKGRKRPAALKAYAEDTIGRRFSASRDTWEAGDLTCSVYSPIKAVPDPAKATKSEMREAVVPAVFVEIEADNRKGKRDRRVFFGYQGRDPYSAMRRLDDVLPFAGVGQGLRTAVVSRTRGVYSGLGFSAEACLRPDRMENLVFGLGKVGLLMAKVPAGKKKTIRAAVCFHRAGTATSGMAARYFYERFFPTIESVAEYALEHWSEQKRLALEADKRISEKQLGADRHFQLCHAIRSYYGSTQFLEADGEPFWVVNEGEYRMMNTFDLTVDHLFFEIDRNPWVVRDQLDWFAKRCAYRDRVRLPGDETEYLGGISFTHDMGVANHLSRPGYSTYELFGKSGTFSHMTHEQLVNWVLCAVTYVRASADEQWARSRLKTFQACLRSLEARDHPDAKRRNGVMGADSSRCLGGAEITTYDSLDVSLARARNNLYLAVKTWAAYLGLREFFAASDDAARAKRAGRQAARCADTIRSHLRPDGFIPAVMGEGNESRIIPAIEGLVFPEIWELDVRDEFPAFYDALERHLRTVLSPGVCLFEDGGWKLSSTNDNSWLSKIYLCQFVAETVFGLAPSADSHRAHRNWLLDPENTYFAWSDQMVRGKARGSKYYPRGVTAWLWLRLCERKR